MKLPFSAYDFFGYLAPGTLGLCAIAVSTGNLWALQKTQPASVILLATVAAYIFGHAIAHLSSDLLEQGFTRRVLGPSERLLLRIGPPSRFWRHLFPEYFAPLPVEVADRVREKAGVRGWGQDARAIFLEASTAVRRDPAIGARLDSFLNLYGFCRNCSMTLLLAAIALAVSARISPDTTKVWLVVGSTLTAALLFLRYLRFYRLYTHEVLLASLETT
jgi:hypothetical protein